MTQPYTKEPTLKQLQGVPASIRKGIRRIYYPCCCMDVSPSVAFPLARVTYVDHDQTTTKILRDHGYQAYAACAREFVPTEQPEVLILLHPMIVPEFPASQVIRGGYVLCNDEHRSATLLRAHPDFRLLGIVRRDVEAYWFDPLAPEVYWEEVETEDELAFSSNFAFYRDFVLRFTGETTNILAAYRKLLARAEHDDALEREQFLKQHPNSIRSEIYFPSLSLQLEGTEIKLLPLPRKKGLRGDLFVFERMR